MNRNSVLLAEFVKYCNEHPHERFWQALRNWSGARFIRYQKIGQHCDGAYSLDTFNWEGKAGGLEHSLHGFREGGGRFCELCGRAKSDTIHLDDAPLRHCSGPLPGRDVTVVQTPDKTLFVRKENGNK